MLSLTKKIFLLVALLFLSSHYVQAKGIVVGGKGFTEQQLLTEITYQYLISKGYDVQRKAGMGSSVLRKAQENGQIDVYWEYTGTSLKNYNKFEKKLPPSSIYEKVKELDEAKGLIWLKPSTANNTYALAMRRDDAEKRGISSLSDLAKSVNDGSGLRLAVNAEFYARDDGLKPMQEAYGFRFPRKDIKRMDSGLTYSALKEEQVEVALVFATDGRIPAFNFIVLKDDKFYFPDYSVVPVIRQDTLEANPELEALLNDLSSKISNQSISKINSFVDVNKLSVEKVAKEFLVNNKLL